MLTTTDLNTTVGDFQRNYLYKLNVVSYPSLIDNLFPGAKNFVTNVDLYAHKFSIPPSSTLPIKIKWSGMWAWFGGPQDVSGDTEVSLRLDRQYQGFDFFNAWKSLSGDDDTGVAALKTQSTGKIEALMVDVDKTTVLKKVVLRDCQIFKCDQIELEKAGEDIVEVKFTIHYEGKTWTAGTGTV